MDAQINTNDEIIVDGDVASCDGGGGELGHPLVYLSLENVTTRQCPYCSKIYRKLESDA